VRRYGVAEAFIKQLRELRRRFDVLHADGLDALRSGDYQRLAQAIKSEGQIIEQQGRLLEDFVLETQRHPRRRLKKLKQA
jgi:hypothetical protein